MEMAHTVVILGLLCRMVSCYLNYSYFDLHNWPLMKLQSLYKYLRMVVVMHVLQWHKQGSSLQLIIIAIHRVYVQMKIE